MADLGVSGLASGFDWKSFIEQMAQVQRAPEQRLRADQNTLTQRNNAINGINTNLATLSTRIDALKDVNLYQSRATTVADADIATVTSSGGSPLGTFALTVTQLATCAKQRGTSNVGAAIASSPNVTGVVLGSAGFSTDIKAGVFTVNGKRITIATTDTLQSVFNAISDATSGAVTASYDPTTDKITFEGSSEVVLGSATDTSNFLAVAKLTNNGLPTIESGGTLGGIRKARTLVSANFATAVSDGGSGAGEFKINGVSISFSATGDSVQSVMDRINNSSAGVTASYDTINDRFVVTSKTTGDQGITLEDVTGNFLAASGVSGGALEHGKNCLYSIDNGGQLTSATNTISSDSSGIDGLTINALDLGTTQFTVSSDTSKIKKAITDFISEYNSLQKLIDKNTASSTDATGKVTAGLLAQDSDSSSIASTLRTTAVSRLANTFSIRSLDDLGIKTNGNDDTIALDDEDKLNAALADNLSAVTNLFTNATTGLAVKFAAYIDKTTGDEGTLPAHQKSLTDQISDIDSQILQMERLIQQQKDDMTERFVKMETAAAANNQQLAYLQKQLGSK